MKRTLNNPNIWQKKRGELPVDGNPEADWIQMRSALDQLMPVTALVKKPYRFKTSKWWFNGLIVTSSVIVLCTAVLLYLSNRHHPIPERRQQNITRDTTVKDSHPNTVITDSAHANTGQNVIKYKKADTIKNRKDTSAKNHTIIPDSNKIQHHADIIPHRDSLLSPVNINLLKTVHDSAKLPVIDNKIIRKDSSGVDKNGHKKRKRTKVGVFI